MSGRERAVGRVRKLLELGRGSASAQEATAAVLAAQRLVVRALSCDGRHEGLILRGIEDGRDAVRSRRLGGRAALGAGKLGGDGR